MKFIHKHHWEIHSVHYTAPTDMDGVNFRGSRTFVDEMQRRVTEGITNIYLQCVVCGDMRARTVYGKFEHK